MPAQGLGPGPSQRSRRAEGRGGAEDVTGSFLSQRPGISEECSQLRLSSSHFRPRPAGAKGACRGHLRNQRDVSQALLWRGTRPVHSSVSRLTPWFLNTPSGSAEPGVPFASPFFSQSPYLSTFSHLLPSPPETS